MYKVLSVTAEIENIMLIKSMKLGHVWSVKIFFVFIYYFHFYLQKYHLV